LNYMLFYGPHLQLVPYLASFCGSKNNRISKDGLLSQWRAYGSDGGYSIVFDTVKLETMVSIESRDYGYGLLRLTAVEYFDRSSHSRYQSGEMQLLEAGLATLICNYIETKDRAWLSQMAAPIVLMSTTHKSIGFSEEEEVRIVAVPLPVFPTIIETAKPKKIETYFHDRNGLIIPHLQLFKQDLPIKRVIVGPHVDSERRVKSVDMLLKANGYPDVKVTASEIPYIGN
jgi:hypothetical protein